MNEKPRTELGGIGGSVPDRVTFHSDTAPDVVDEIVFASTDVHIEQMDKGCYWMRFGDRVFWAQAHKGGQLTIKEGDR